MLLIPLLKKALVLDYFQGYSEDKFIQEFPHAGGISRETLHPDQCGSISGTSERILAKETSIRAKIATN